MSRKLNAFDHEIIASIMDEDMYFDMSRFTTGNEALPATCDTASCMAGHIVALRPALTNKIIGVRTCWLHGGLASDVYFRETGQECQFDFYASNTEKGFTQITREDAVLHIKGEHPEWPLNETDVYKETE